MCKYNKIRKWSQIIKTLMTSDSFLIWIRTHILLWEYYFVHSCLDTLVINSFWYPVHALLGRNKWLLIHMLRINITTKASSAAECLGSGLLVSDHRPHPPADPEYFVFWNSNTVLNISCFVGCVCVLHISVYVVCIYVCVVCFVFSLMYVGLYFRSDSRLSKSRHSHFW